MSENSFEFSYSAKEQDEINRIEKKYLEVTDSKLKQLRDLDRKVVMKGIVVAVLIGIVGSVIFALGLCCILVWTDYFGQGIVIGVLGMIIMGLALPINRWITDKQKEKYADQILKLVEEIKN